MKVFNQIHFSPYSDYDLQILLDEAVEQENYEYAADIKNEMHRRQTLPKDVPTGGYSPDVAFITPVDLDKLTQDIDQKFEELKEKGIYDYTKRDPISDNETPMDHTFEFLPNPYSVLPFGEQVRSWEEWLSTPMEFGFACVSQELFSRIYNYLQKSDNLSLKSFLFNNPKPGDSCLTIFVRRTNAGIEEFDLFKRIFFPET